MTTKTMAESGGAGGEVVMENQAAGCLTTHRRRTVYRSTVTSAAQPLGYPAALRCQVTQNILAPHQEELQACQILGPATASIELNFFLKLGKQLLAADSLLSSSLFSEIIRELGLLVDQDTNSIKAIGEARLVPDKPTACCVPLQLWPLEGPLKQSMDNYRPCATVESIDLQLEYAFHSKTNPALQGAASNIPNIDFRSLIRIQPLVLPLKLSLGKVMLRFVNQNLLKQLPLVFNSHWQKESLPKQQLVSRILTRFSLKSISDDLRVELNLHKREENDQDDGDEKSASNELSKKLLELQLSVGKIPNTRISRPRVKRSLSSVSCVSSRPDAMVLDPAKHPEDMSVGWVDHNSDAFSDLDASTDFVEDMSDSDLDHDILSN